MNRGKIQGWAQAGGGVVTISGAGTASIKVQESFISCTVTVYQTGTLTLATLYSDATGTAKANPFTASTTGLWFFYIDDGRYDVRFSGGSITTPFTLGDLSVNVETLDICNNVKYYGAHGDGVTDDSPAFLAAVTALAAGSTLCIPAGTYLLTTGVTDGGKEIHFKGSGATSIVTGSGVSIIALTSSSSTVDNLYIVASGYSANTIGVDIQGGLSGVGFNAVTNCAIYGYFQNPYLGYAIKNYFGMSGKYDNNLISYWEEGIRFTSGAGMKPNANLVTANKLRANIIGFHLAGTVDGLELIGNTIEGNLRGLVIDGQVGSATMVYAYGNHFENNNAPKVNVDITDSDYTSINNYYGAANANLDIRVNASSIYAGTIHSIGDYISAGVTNNSTGPFTIDSSRPFATEVSVTGTYPVVLIRPPAGSGIGPQVYYSGAATTLKYSFKNIRPTATSTNTSAERGLLSEQFNDNTTPAQIALEKSRGTATVPVIVTSGDHLGQIQFRGWDGNEQRLSSIITAATTGTIANDRIPSELLFGTTENTSPADLIYRWKISHDGHLKAYVDNTYDIGTSADKRPRTGYFSTSVVAPVGTFATSVQAGANGSVTAGLNWAATASVADGGNITHGAGATPTAVICTPSVTGEMVSVTAIGATTFTVAIKKHDNSAGTTQTIYWIALR